MTGEVGRLTVENDAGRIRLLHIDNFCSGQRRVKTHVESFVVRIGVQFCDCAKWLRRVGYDYIEQIPARLQSDM